MDPSRMRNRELYQVYRAHCMQNGEYIQYDGFLFFDGQGWQLYLRKNTGVQVD